MKKRSVTFVLTAATLCIAAQNASAQQVSQEVDPKDQAKKSATAFFNALLAADLNAAMKLVDVPWFMDRQKVLQDKSEVETQFQGFVDKAREGIVKLNKVIVVEDVENGMLARGEEQLKLLRSVTKEGDLVLQVVFETKDSGEEAAALLVRPGKDGAKIIGISD